MVYDRLRNSKKTEIKSFQKDRFDEIVGIYQNKYGSRKIKEEYLSIIDRKKLLKPATTIEIQKIDKSKTAENKSPFRFKDEKKFQTRKRIS